jgi:hypothetical protein
MAIRERDDKRIEKVVNDSEDLILLYLLHLHISFSYRLRKDVCRITDRKRYGNDHYKRSIESCINRT